MSEVWSACRVLVTGGLGFIGSNLVLKLLENGSCVTVVDRVSGEFGGKIQNLGAAVQDITLHDVDIRDSAAMDDIIPEHDVIFSLAGQVSHPNSMSDPLLDLDLNCRAQLQMLESCRHFNPGVRIVFASTRQIYGRPMQMPVTEAHPLVPVDVNGVCKLATEELFRLYNEVYGLRTVSLRLTNTYGPRMDLINAGRGFINVCLKRALAGETVQLFGDGKQLRDFVYVDDVVDAMLRASMLNSGWGQAFNVSCARAVSLQSFVTVLREHLEFNVETIPFPAERKAIDVGDYVGCSSRFHDLTGWEPMTNLADGIRATVEWHRIMSTAEHQHLSEGRRIDGPADFASHGSSSNHAQSTDAMPSSVMTGDPAT